MTIVASYGEIEVDKERGIIESSNFQSIKKIEQYHRF